jgi:CBS-domain-containing membrane protein
VLLGRVRASALSDGGPATRVEEIMEPGPKTVRPSEAAADLLDRLASRELHTAILTTPEGVLFGVFHRADAERRLADPNIR